MTRAEEQTIRLGAYNECLDHLRRSSGKTEAMEYLEWERDMIRAEIKRLLRASRAGDSHRDTPAAVGAEPGE